MGMLEGRVALCAGSGRGVGAEVAKLMADGAKFEDGMDVPGLGKAHVDVNAKTIAINKIMRVNKETIDELLKMGI